MIVDQTEGIGGVCCLDSEGAMDVKKSCACLINVSSVLF